jgi:hypothetical protein
MGVQRFCHNCGKSVQVGSKFCPECGTNLLSLSSVPAPPAPTRPAAQTFTPFEAKGDDDDDSYIDRMEHLNIRQSALQVEIIKDKPQQETVGATVIQGMSSPPSSNEQFTRNQPYQNIDPSVFIADFKKEAGTLRHE